MRRILAKWVSDADTLRYLEQFNFQEVPLKLAYIHQRSDDLYISLVGELFHRIHEPYSDPNFWAHLGNAFAQFADYAKSNPSVGILSSEAAFFAAAAFYFGGFPASACLTLKSYEPLGLSETHLACFDLLARPIEFRSDIGKMLLLALREGNMQVITDFLARAIDEEKKALAVGPDEWVAWRMLRTLTERFSTTNIRAVLPNDESQFWTPLVRSLLNRTQPIWDFFPSQIEAIKSGLLEASSSFSIQMPTSAGKTALCEVLLYSHLKMDSHAAAILIVPYRSLAYELRSSLAKRLNDIGLPTRCAYGGTIPAADEVQNFEQLRVLIATPESLSGLLSSNYDFFRRVSLVICDEGHLLDEPSRGVSLELLLARMKTRRVGAPRFVFVSAIVPNIEEINSWLGGSLDTVVRSEYRPAVAEFSVLYNSGSGINKKLSLKLHPHLEKSLQFSVDNFLSLKDFKFVNPRTNKDKTYHFASIKAQSIASARKALSMGAAVVFAANKNGNQGAIGLAEELLNQLVNPLPLPKPIDFADQTKVNDAVAYLRLEYGPDWIGTKALSVGAVLHHGDILQETREVLESLVRNEHIKFAICTSTLAEGVNLPIRTIVLYSVERKQKDGTRISLLTRDIKNLVGRAGRAGSTTRGLVICANKQVWSLVKPVALSQPGEQVFGALHKLLGRMHEVIFQNGLILTNDLLESATRLHSLIDGIDCTLINLASEEMGESELVQLAVQLGNETFAARQSDDDALRVMQSVFELRAKRISVFQANGRLTWFRETGARPRILDKVEHTLLPLILRSNNITGPTDPSLLEVILPWAWEQPEFKGAIKRAVHAGMGYEDPEHFKEGFSKMVSLWISGNSFVEITKQVDLEINSVLQIHTQVIAYVLQMLVEQAVALLGKLVEEQDGTLANAIKQFPEHLRFGVPSASALALSKGGIRHRRASVMLGDASKLKVFSIENPLQVYVTALHQLQTEPTYWQEKLSSLVYFNTMDDLIKLLPRKEP